MDIKMSGSIKPGSMPSPGGADLGGVGGLEEGASSGAITGPDGAGQSDPSGAVEPSSEASGVGAVQTDAATRASTAAEVSGGASVDTSDPVQGWLLRLERGEVSRAEAVEGIVNHILDSQGGEELSASRRAELAEVLRDTLTEDPILAPLLGGDG